MFSGIVQAIGQVERVEKVGSGTRVDLWTGTELQLGESLAVNGVCLTVSEILEPVRHSFFVSSETLGLTNLKNLQSKSYVNLEQSLRLQDRLSGHWVQGHVEGMAEILELKKVGEDSDLVIRLPKKLLKFCIHKGSICLDGVSLTINSIEDAAFEKGDGRLSIRLVPHTLKATRFQYAKPGDFLNVETDILAKYVERLTRHD